MLAHANILPFFCLLLAAHAGQPPGCTPIAGTELLWQRPGLHFVLVGEMHGTAETPAIFADLVCSAREIRRPIIAGIEFRDQHALDAFMNSGSRNAGLKELLSTEEWKQHDGRTSSAMLALVDQLRALKLEGLLSGVVAFARTDKSAARGEERMASALLKALKRNPAALVIALSGNVHACRKTVAEVPYRLMGSFLPAAQTVSLLVTDRGGQAWNCQDGVCGPHGLGSSRGLKRGIALASPYPGYDGALSTGLLATPSLPATR